MLDVCFQAPARVSPIQADVLSLGIGAEFERSVKTGRDEVCGEACRIEPAGVEVQRQRLAGPAAVAAQGAATGEFQRDVVELQRRVGAGDFSRRLHAQLERREREVLFVDRTGGVVDEVQAGGKAGDGRLFFCRFVVLIGSLQLGLDIQTGTRCACRPGRWIDVAQVDVRRVEGHFGEGRQDGAELPIDALPRLRGQVEAGQRAAGFNGQDHRALLDLATDFGVGPYGERRAAIQRDLSADRDITGPQRQRVDRVMLAATRQTGGDVGDRRPTIDDQRVKRQLPDADCQRQRKVIGQRRRAGRRRRQGVDGQRGGAQGADFQPGVEKCRRRPLEFDTARAQRQILVAPAQFIDGQRAEQAPLQTAQTQLAVGDRRQQAPGGLQAAFA